MALERADRVGEVTASTGTGTLNLGGGAVSGFRTFADAGISSGATVEYLLIEGTDWEIGEGTFTNAATDTLSRTTILASTNGGAAVDFGSAPTAYITLPAARATVRFSPANDSNLLIGPGATCHEGSSNQIVIGKNADSDDDQCVAIGPGAHTNKFSVAIGMNTLCHSGEYNIAVGQAADCAGGTSCTLVGAETRNGAANNSTVICLGRGADSTANNQLVVGSALHPITDAYFGEGVASATPQTIAINATGGSGTDIAGGGLTLAGGKGTGAGLGGHIVFQTAEAGVSGTSLNSLVTHLEITDDGLILMPTLPTSDPSVAGAIWSNSGVLTLSAA